MVQIKKKVTLKTKTEQGPEVVDNQQQAVQPTLRKKGTTSAPTSVPSEGNEKGNKTNVIGGIVALALVGILGYGAYTLLSSSDDNSNSTPIIENVEKQTVVNSDEEANITDKQNETESVDNNQADNGTETLGESTPSLANEKSPSESATDPEQNDSVKSTEVESNSSSISTDDSNSLSGTLEQKAKDVIRGDYGNGEMRKQKLGNQYSEIQNKVNEMYRNGLVK